MHRNSSRVLLIAAAFMLLLIPIGAIAAGPSFSDVPPTDWAYQDVEWLAATGVTKGCNAAGTEFCPDAPVTRREMAAFMHRLATYKVVDAKTAASSEVKIRYSAEAFDLDLGANVSGTVRCTTAPVTFDGVTTVVASGGISLEPWATSTTRIFGFVMYTTDGGAVWHTLGGVGVEDSPGVGGTGDASVPVDAAANLPAGRYRFAIDPGGADYQGGNDYSGFCELTVTAYTGLGSSIDFVAGA